MQVHGGRHYDEWRDDGLTFVKMRLCFLPRTHVTLDQTGE